MIKINGYELPAHVSHSQITTWSSCGHKYYLNKVVQVPESGTWWLVGGSSVHEATEAYDRAIWERDGK
jgi:hypothetical protein